ARAGDRARQERGRRAGVARAVAPGRLAARRRPRPGPYLFGGGTGPGMHEGLPGRRAWPGGHGKVGLVVLGSLMLGEPGGVAPGAGLLGMPGVVVPGGVGVVPPGVGGATGPRVPGAGGAPGVPGVCAAAAPASMRLVATTASGVLQVMVSSPLGISEEQAMCPAGTWTHSRRCGVDGRGRRRRGGRECWVGVTDPLSLLSGARLQDAPDGAAQGGDL